MLCVHASKENWRSLKPVVDLAGFLDKNPHLDWGELLSQARQWGCLRMPLLGLQLAHTLLGIDIPPPCQPLISGDKAVQTWSCKLIDTMSDGTPPPPNPYRIDQYSLAIRERWSDKLRFVFRTAVTPRTAHYEFIDLPDALNWLYVPIKLGLDYIVTPARNLARTAFTPKGQKA